MRRFLLLATVASLTGAPQPFHDTAAQDARPALYVVGRKPSEVAVLAPPDYRVIKRIPIGSNPTHAAIGGTGKRMYVVHDGYQAGSGETKKPSSLSVVDFDEGRVVATVSVGLSVRDINFSDDDRYVIFEAGSPSFVVVDALKATVVRSSSTAVPGPVTGRFRTKNGTKDFVLSRGGVGTKTNRDLQGAVLTVFDVTSANPVATVEFAVEPSLTLLSPDERWLYIVEPLSRGEALDTEAVIHAFDVSSLKVASTNKVGVGVRSLAWDSITGTATLLSQASKADRTGRLFRLQGPEILSTATVGADPRSVVRVEGIEESIVLSVERLDLVAKDGNVRLAVRLNRLDGQPRLPQEIDGLPGGLVAMPDGKRFVLEVHNSRGVADKIALIDLQSGSVEKVIKTPWKPLPAAGVGSFAFTQYLVAQASGLPLPLGFFASSFVRPFAQYFATGHMVYGWAGQWETLGIDTITGKVARLCYSERGWEQAIMAPSKTRFVLAEGMPGRALCAVDMTRGSVAWLYRQDRIVMVRSIGSGQLIGLLHDKSLVLLDPENGRVITEVMGMPDSVLMLEGRD